MHTSLNTAVVCCWCCCVTDCCSRPLVTCGQTHQSDDMTTGGLEQGSSLEAIANLSLHGFPMGSMGGGGKGVEPQLELTGAGSGTWKPLPRAHHRDTRNNTTHASGSREQAVKTPQTPSRNGRSTWPGCACRIPFVIRTKAVPTLPDYLGAFESLGRTPRVGDREDARLRISGQMDMGATSCRGREISFPAAASGRDSASRKEWTNETWTSRSFGCFRGWCC